MVYINNIYTGLLVFPFIAAVITLPYAVYQYNRHGVLIGGISILAPESENHFLYILFSSWTFFYLYSLIQVILTKGSTLGHGLCRMVLVSEKGGVATTGQFVKRYLYLWLFTEFPMLFARMMTGGPLETPKYSFLFLALVLISRLYFAAYLIIAVSQKSVRIPHERLSGTFYMATVVPENEK